MSQEQPKAKESAAPPHAEAGPSKAELYPNHLGLILSEETREADEFDLIREQMLLPYGYNTARAYWGDLEHWRDWCVEQEPPVGPLRPSTADIGRYLDDMGITGYSPNTRARRLTALRRLLSHRTDGNPTEQVAAIKRRSTNARLHSGSQT